MPTTPFRNPERPPSLVAGGICAMLGAAERHKLVFVNSFENHLAEPQRLVPFSGSDWVEGCACAMALFQPSSPRAGLVQI